MRGPVAARAEIIDRADDPLAEQLLPDAIHHHSRGQRIVSTRDPVGQLPATALAFGDRCRLVSRQNVHEPSSNHITQRMSIAANRDPHVGRFRGIVRREGNRHGRGEELSVLDVPVERPDAGIQLRRFSFSSASRERLSLSVMLLPLRVVMISVSRCLARSRSALSVSIFRRCCASLAFRSSLALGFWQLDNRRPTPDAPLGTTDRFGTVKDASHCVVVALRNRIEFVIVTPRQPRVSPKNALPTLSTC